MAKVIVLLAWIWGATSLLGPSLGLDIPGARYGAWMFWFLLIAHVIECIVFLPKMRRAEGSLFGHLANTFVFGIIHVRSLPRPSSD